MHPVIASQYAAEHVHDMQAHAAVAQRARQARRVMRIVNVPTQIKRQPQPCTDSYARAA